MERREIIGGTLLGALGIGGAAMIQVGPTLFSNHAELIFWIGVGLVVVAVVGLLALFVRKPQDATRADDGEVRDWGDDNTVIGEAPERMGSRNTIVNFSDANGDTILNRGSVSIGAGAGFDPTSVIIGSGAGANLGKKPSDPNGD